MDHMAAVDRLSLSGQGRPVPAVRQRPLSSRATILLPARRGSLNDRPSSWEFRSRRLALSRSARVLCLGPDIPGSRTRTTWRDSRPALTQPRLRPSTGCVGRAGSLYWFCDQCWQGVRRSVRFSPWHASDSAALASV